MRARISAKNDHGSILYDKYYESSDDDSATQAEPLSALDIHVGSKNDEHEAKHFRLLIHAVQEAAHQLRCPCTG